ncbi:MAG: glucosaminidase domain-containing protein [Hyphomicrobiaceae bacterium]
MRNRERASMKWMGGSAIILCLAAMQSSVLAASRIPQVLLTQYNQPEACLTPGRLMAFVRSRNPNLRERFSDIAVHYARHGQELNIRWDFAFFQMLLETASLRFGGDVKWHQNNFAGLGATGGGVRGENFRTVSDGVRAHLEHLLIYAGVRVESPVAERTRKVQAWNILTKWRRSIRGPVTYGHIGSKWAPSDRDYARDILSVANAFHTRQCNSPDPQPELLAQLQGRIEDNERPNARPSPIQTANGSDVSSQTQTAPLKSRISSRVSLGASTVYRRGERGARQEMADTKQDTVLQADVRRELPSDLKILNGAPRNGETQDQSSPTARALTPPPTSKKSQLAAQKRSLEQLARGVEQNDQVTKDQRVKEQSVASAAGSLASKFATPWLNPATQQQNSGGASTKADSGPAQSHQKQPDPTKCRVWTASYGGQKAIIIKSADQSHVNYTVLDVNSGREKQEADAYISAYAKGGKKIAEFKSQTLALDRAFKLCPDS